MGRLGASMPLVGMQGRLAGVWGRCLIWCPGRIFSFSFSGLWSLRFLSCLMRTRLWPWVPAAVFPVIEGGDHESSEHLDGAGGVFAGRSGE